MIGGDFESLAAGNEPLHNVLVNNGVELFPVILTQATMG